MTASPGTAPGTAPDTLPPETSTSVAGLAPAVARLRPSGPAATPAPLNAIAQEVLSINLANGWDVMTPERYSASLGGDDYAIAKVATVLCLIHSEVSEALEALRKRDRANLEEELADVVIRCLDFAGGAGINLDGVVAAKLERNRGRGYRHGGKAV